MSASIAIILSATAHGKAPYSLDPGLEFSLLSTGFVFRGYAEQVFRDGILDQAEAPDKHSSYVPAFDRWALGFHSARMDRMSTKASGALLAVPAALLLFDVASGFEPSSAIVRDLILGSEVFCFASGLPLISKAWLERPRPLAYGTGSSPGQSIDTDYDASFFSAHTTGAFATAVFTAYTYQMKHPDSPAVPWLWAGMVGAAGSVGAMRIGSGMHFLSDVAVGAMVGSACGYLIPRFHRSRTMGSSGDSRREKERQHDLIPHPTLLWAQAANIPAPGLVVYF